MTDERKGAHRQEPSVASGGRSRIGAAATAEGTVSVKAAVPTARNPLPRVMPKWTFKHPPANLNGGTHPDKVLGVQLRRHPKIGQNEIGQNEGEQREVEQNEARVALWEWPNVLSLDAPLIAVLWQGLFARTLGAALGGPHGVLLGAAVWLIYSADRLLDAHTLGAGARTRRHRFYVRHRRVLGLLWLGAGAAVLAACAFGLRPAEFAAGAGLAALLLGYLFRRHRGDRRAHPKEGQIALIFALGVTFLPLLRGAPALPLAGLGGLFGVLIFLNCAFIARWEGELDLEPAPFAERAPWAAAHLGVLALAFAVFCSAAAALAEPLRPALLALGGSAGLLWGLNLHFGPDPAGTPCSPAARRVLADAALLTPLLALLLGRF